MFLIDYFSFTIQFEGVTLDYVYDLLRLRDYEHFFQDIGAHDRYEHCYKYGQIEIMTPYEKRYDMGIFVNMTGQGCRDYENCFKNLYGNDFEWKYLLKRLINEVNNYHKVNVTRIDLAFDDFDGKLDMQIIKNKLLNGEYTSRFKKWSDVESNKTYTKKGCVGQTFYIGSKQSNCYCKFYDKLAEQIIKNKGDEFVLKKLESMNHWVRFEITFKQKTAMLICNILCYSNDVDKEISEYINKCFRFIELTKSNISRCPVSDFWVDFIKTSDVSKFRLIQSDLQGYDKTYKWFACSLAPTLFALMSTYPNRSDFVRDIVVHGAFRVNERHKQIINCESSGLKLSNLDLWSKNNPYEGIWRYDIDYDDSLKHFDYKPYR